MLNRVTVAWLLVGRLPAGSPTYAQTPSGSLSGTVSDSTGAAVAGARVSIVNVGTAQVRDQTTSEQGLFTAAALLPGPYRVTVQADGFKRFERDVIVEAGTSGWTSR